MPSRLLRVFLLLAVVALTDGAHAAPPFSGTIFLDPDIITSADPTTFVSLSYAGQGVRTMYDRRVEAFISLNAYLFNATFSDGLTSEVQVNPEFGTSAAAQAEAQKYAVVIGRLPKGLRVDVATVWIHKGVNPFGGGNNNLLIHTGQGLLYEADGILEETFVHEASHTSLDGPHAAATAWLSAQAADGEFISTYARDNPTREDVAESFLTYLAIRFRAGRISPSLANTIEQTIPNRIAYFDAANIDMSPISPFANDGTANLGVPVVTAPSVGQTLVVTGVSFNWSTISGATGYDIRVASAGALVFSGSLSGGASTSTLISLPAGAFQFAVRACAGGFSASQCGGYGMVSFTVAPAAPSGAPTVTLPALGANLSSSTQTLAWTAVSPNPALSGLSYEVLLRDLAAGTTALQITVPSPTLSTIFTMKSSTQYELKVRACQAGCGPYSPPVTFAVNLPPVPVATPSGVSCLVSGGNNLSCNWSAVSGADAYQIQVVQAPPAGPGGGALTAAARQVSATSATLPVPAGAATVLIAACNGNGCGPNAARAINAAGPNPAQANLGTPMAGAVVNGPGVLFTWNRLPGDNGSNTKYRLFVQDLSRQATALDVFTTSNFYSAYFKAEGARYDALVVSNPGLSGQATGPSQGFNVAGSSATAPTMVSPAHNGTVNAGNIQLGWSPVPGATLYEYYVAVLGQGSATVRGVTPGLLAQVPLAGSGAGTVYSGIVRACPAGATCASGADAGWGPWSNASGGPGVTNFTVVP